MKRFQKASVFLLIAALLLGLCSCAEKVKPEKIDTKVFSREIQIIGSGEGLEIVHADKSTQAAQQGDTLKSDDSLRVDAGGELVLRVDEDKQVYGEGGSSVRLEASGTPEQGKTRFCLEEGGLLLGTEQALAQGELLEIQIGSITVSVPEGIARAVKIRENNTDYTLVEVFEGKADVVIRASGETIQLEAGEAALIQEAGKKTRFVRADEIDSDFWRSSLTTGLQVGSQGTGAVELPIPYSKLPEGVLRQLLEYAKNGHTLSLTESTLTNLLETGHDYVETVTKEPNCTEDGLMSLECALCGDQKEEPIPALGHTEETVPGVEATCTEDGMTEGTRCAVCGEILVEGEAIPALGHNPVTDEAVEATCTETGLTQGTHCEICGEVLTPQETVPALGHQETQDDSQAATCTQDGRNAQVCCTICGEILQEEEILPALGHEPEELPAVEATCEEAGLTAGEKCSVCGEIITPQETVPALGHCCETLPGKAATCTETGLTEGQQCSRCGKLLEPQQTIPLLDHVPETVAGKAATCTEEGYTESQVCAVCGGVLTPAETLPMLEHRAEVIPGKGATCEKTGLTEGSRCADCGVILAQQEEIPAHGHDPVEMPRKEATCSSIGLTAGQRCRTCHKILVRQSVIPRLEHTPKTVRGLYATCFREGSTDSVVCAVCGYVIEPGQVIPALPHTRGGLAAVPATCTKTGLTEGLACRVCSYVIQAQKVVPKLAHTAMALPAVAATCTTDGLTEGSMCAVCGEILTAQVRVPAGHQMTAGAKQTNPAEPPLDGSGNLDAASGNAWCYSITHSCSRCSHTSTEYGSHIPGAAAVEEIGGGQYNVVRCTGCGKIISKVSIG